MSRRAKSGRGARTQPAGRGVALSSWVWVISIGLAVGFASPASFMILICGLAPTFAAISIDLERARHLTQTVFAANLAGAVPFLLRLWLGEGSIEHALALLGNPFVWFAMYGAAAIGWLLLGAVPATVHAVVDLRARRRIAVLRRHQADLVEEWGADIRREAGSEPDDAPEPAADAATARA